MAHIVASITVFVNAPPLYLPRRYAKRKDCPDAPVPLPARTASTGHVFQHLYVLPPNKGDLLYLIRIIRSITDRTNPGYCV